MSLMRTSPRHLLAVAVPLALILGACSGAGASTAPAAAPPGAPRDAPAVAPSAPPAAATIGLAENALGQILVDAEGVTLYGFTVDADGVSAATTTAPRRPPLLADGEGPSATA
jgi:hypothetical protein